MRVRILVGVLLVSACEGERPPQSNTTTFHSSCAEDFLARLRKETEETRPPPAPPADKQLRLMGVATMMPPPVDDRALAAVRLELLECLDARSPVGEDATQRAALFARLSSEADHEAFLHNMMSVARGDELANPQRAFDFAAAVIVIGSELAPESEAVVGAINFGQAMLVPTDGMKVERALADLGRPSRLVANLVPGRWGKMARVAEAYYNASRKTTVTAEPARDNQIGSD